MRFTIPDPQWLEFTDWAQRCAATLEQAGPVPDAARMVGTWHDWACAVVCLPDIAKLQPPDPFQSDDWRDWATRFKQVLQ